MPDIASIPRKTNLYLSVINFALRGGEERHRQWVSDILDEVASSSGFALVKRLKYLPPFGADRDLPAGTAFQSITDTKAHVDYRAYLSPAGTEPWRSNSPTPT
jgi:hypothetical protein